MNKIKQHINSKKIRNFKNWVKEHGLIKYIIISLAIIYVLVTYEDQYITWYDENVIPILSHFKSNPWMIFLSFIMIFVAIRDIVKKFKVCYQHDKKEILLLCVAIGLLINRRINGNYDYVKLISCRISDRIYECSYVDVIIFFSCLYIIVAIWNKCKMYYRLYCCKGELSDGDENNKDNDSILNDWPIINKDDDIFDLKNDVENIAGEIKKLDRKKTWSIAITAPWGTGKTSFLNLILEYISEKDFEVVRFIPRESKSFKYIQEDFFTTIACVLSKYDSRCSNILKDYMASLQLIDNRGVVEKFVNFYKIWNKGSLKDSIKKTFVSLDKKVLVLIDDFDRLSKDEILEVLKLIDSNAAFTNLVFLTAYDKEQVNNSLGAAYNTKDACFVDKFFNMEFSIPSRPYSYISRFVEDKLYEKINASDDEKKIIQQTLTNHISIFGKYIPTLRDAKRYINQFVLDFQQVRGDVMIDEFLLVQLIKYRYPEQYKSMFKREYVNIGVKYYPMNILCLKGNPDKDKEILDVLELLFPKDESHREQFLIKGNRFDGQSYKHIYDNDSFNNYFVNQIYSSLRIRDMESLFLLQWDEVSNKIDDWIENGNKSKDFIDYLNSLDMDNFENGGKYIRYTEMVSYVACKLPNSRAYWLFMKVIYEQNIVGYDKKYKLNSNSYKERLLEILKKDEQLTLMRFIYSEYKTKRRKDDDYIIKENDLWPDIKNVFIEKVKDNSFSDQNLISWLYHCIDEMEDETRQLKLNKDCLDAYRKRVEKNPRWYIKNFVRLGMYPSNPDFNTVACEPFWRQIFGNESEFENFLNKCKKEKVEKIDLVWNFWQLYKANDLKEIQFENQGSFQEKIDNNLKDEVDKLEKMKNIGKEVSQIPDNLDSISIEDKNRYKKILRQCETKLNRINLYISLNGQIRKAIEEKLKKVE